jgi:drug/metabolite transporter (DMT)-like permease
MKRFRVEHVFMLIFAFFGALGHPLGRIIVRDMHPIQLGTVSLIVGFIVIVLFMVISGRIGSLFRIARKDIFLSAGIGVLGFFFFQMLTFSALSRIPASVNAFLINTSVVYISLLASLVLKERVPPMRVLAIGLALAGVVLVVFNRGFGFGGGVDLLGCAFSIAGAVSFALYSVLGKRLLERNDPIHVVAIAVFSGSILLAILTRFTTGYASLMNVQTGTWLLTILLGATMIGLAYPMWFLGLKGLPASHISIYVYMTPLFAVVLSYLILGETFGLYFWLGAGLILVGIVMSDRCVKAEPRESGRFRPDIYG